jgi:predicted amidohydrolase
MLDHGSVVPDHTSMPNQAVQAAAIQLSSGSNVNANLLETERLVEAAVAEGAKLVVLPENFAFMGRSTADLIPLREREGDGPLQEFLSRLAARLKIWVVGGTIPLEAQANAKVRSACLVFDDRGQQVLRYDKMHLFDVHLAESGEDYAESDHIEAGDGVGVVDTPFGRLGVAVCYDLRFPELFRAMIDQGAEILALPAAFTAVTGKAHWEVLLRARAIENLSYVVAAAQGGFHVNGRETFGHSMVVDPWGSVLSVHPRGNGAAIANIDGNLLRQTRRNFPCVDHRRLHCR